MGVPRGLVNALVLAALASGGLAVATPTRAQPEPTVDRALEMLSSADATERAHAAEVLGRHGQERRDAVVPPLRARLRDDPDWHVRASSGRALGRLAARDAVPDLVHGLRDPVIDVRVVSAAALWRLPDPAAVVPLLELLRDADPAARQWAALALGVIRDRRATAPLASLLSDVETEVRLDAIRSLGRLRDPSAAAALDRHVRDGSRATEERLEALDAIGSLDGPEKVDVLARLMRHPDVAVRARAAEALGRVGDALAVPALRERRREERSATVRSAIDLAISSIQHRAAGTGSAGSGHPLNLPPL
jgi:HEAT repeat protein